MRSIFLFLFRVLVYIHTLYPLANYRSKLSISLLGNTCCYKAEAGFYYSIRGNQKKREKTIPWVPMVSSLFDGSLRSIAACYFIHFRSINIVSYSVSFIKSVVIFRKRPNGLLRFCFFIHWPISTRWFFSAVVGW